jgi:hypothetical protein
MKRLLGKEDGLPQSSKSPRMDVDPINLRRPIAHGQLYRHGRAERGYVRLRSWFLPIPARPSLPSRCSFRFGRRLLQAGIHGTTDIPFPGHLSPLYKSAGNPTSALETS